MGRLPCVSEASFTTKGVMDPGKEVLLLDGGLGTSLEDHYGVVFGKSTPLWSSHLLLGDPDTLLLCQKDFGDIPVDILMTATYQVSATGLAATRTDEFPDGVHGEASPKVLERAVAIANEATSGSAAIALSLGPYGACMVPSQEYSGKYDEHHSSVGQLQRWHDERLALFRHVNLDPVRFVAFETIPRRDEIVAVRRAFAAAPAALRRLPFWTACLFPSAGQRLPDGSSIDQVMGAMLDPELAGAVPWGVGINCTKIAKLQDLVLGYEAAVSRLDAAGKLQAWPVLLLYPDGTNGEVYDTETQQWVASAEAAEGVSCLTWCPNASAHVDDKIIQTMHNRTASGTPDLTSGYSQGAPRVPWEEQLAAIVEETRARGKWKQIVVGGCCKASAEHIRRLGRVLRLRA
jgi:homocysteine S-methyltransferase